MNKIVVMQLCLNLFVFYGLQMSFTRNYREADYILCSILPVIIINSMKHPWLRL